MSAKRPIRRSIVFLKPEIEKRFGIPVGKRGHRWLCVHNNGDVHCPTVLLCYITSIKAAAGNIKHRQPTDVFLKPENVTYVPGAENAEQVGNAYVRCNTIYSVEPAGIGDPLAHVCWLSLKWRGDVFR